MKRVTTWTPELDALVRREYPTTTAHQLAQRIGCTTFALHARANKLGVRKAPGWSAANARETVLARSPFTPEIREIVQLLYPDTDTRDIAALTGISVPSLQAWATKHGLHKTKEFLRQAGAERAARNVGMRRTQFPKGNRPANAGVKGWQAGGRSVLTRFKPGQLSPKFVPVGSYRVNSCGVLDRKVSATGRCNLDWKAAHRLVWEEAHGPVPAGHVVRFRAGMRTTDPALLTVDRLECVTRAEHATRNAWHSNISPALRDLRMAQLSLNRAMKKAQQRLNDEDHDEHEHEPAAA